jgi:hypothetical protein
MLLRTLLPALLPALALALALAAAAPGHAAETACPAAIVETPSVALTDDAWQLAAAPGERPLEHAGIYLGALAQLGAQVPDSTRKKQLTETVTWRLRRADADQFWIGCSYVGTTALLARPIAPGATECVVSYELLRTGRRQRLTGIACR